MKISVITTVYKAEDTLLKMLDSMMEQKSPDLEFFLIDNGSPDSCGTICLDYAKRDHRFKILTLAENVGYIKARNIGIERCDADYIGFCDSDDYLEAGGYDRVVSSVNNTNCDLYIASWNTINRSIIKTNELPYEEGVYDEEQISQQILPNAFGPINGKHALAGFAWKMIYKRDLVRKYSIKFIEELKPYEDQIFNIDILKKCKKVVVDNNSIYNYVINENSLTNAMVNNFDADSAWERLYLLYHYKCERVANEKELTATCNSSAAALYSFLLNIVKNSKNGFEANRVLKEVVDKQMIREVRDHYVTSDKRYRWTMRALSNENAWLEAFVIRAILKIRNKHNMIERKISWN